MQFDLFDQIGAREQVGERQTDLEEILAMSFEESLAGRVLDGDDEGAEELIVRARRGEIIRIM